MANNVTVRDASGANQTFNTTFDNSLLTHRSHVINHPQVANVDVSNNNPLPVYLIFTNGIDNTTKIYQVVAPSQFALTVTNNTMLSVPPGALVAQISVEGGNIRYTDDGTSANSTIGQPVYANTSFQYSGSLTTIKFSPVSGSPTLNVSYYK